MDSSSSSSIRVPRTSRSNAENDSNGAEAADLRTRRQRKRINQRLRRKQARAEQAEQTEQAEQAEQVEQAEQADKRAIVDDAVLDRREGALKSSQANLTQVDHARTTRQPAISVVKPTSESRQSASAAASGSVAPGNKPFINRTSPSFHPSLSSSSTSPSKNQSNASTSTGTTNGPVDAGQTGLHPNVQWRAVTKAELRMDARMLALPPPDRLASVGPALQDYRFVRQDTELWKALHHGVVTSSGIATMAGLRERQAVGLLGLAKHYVKHDAIREIVQSLREARLHDSDLHHQQEDAIAVALRAMHLSGSPKNPQASPTNDHVLTAYNSPSTKELGSKIHVGESLPHRPVASALSEFPDATAARLRWGSAQEPSSVLSLLDIFPAPNYRVAECGMFLLDWDAEGVTSRMNQLGFTRDMLPPLGASPDGLLFHRPVTEHHANNADCVVDPDTAKYVPFDVSLATMSPRAEILEIKNTCPFVEAKGQGKHKFRWLAMQPQEQIASMNIPQLQLQMFVANVQSALYISVSATRGLNIFRVMRDDEYVRLLLRLVHFTYKHCVVDGNEPVEDLHAGRPELRQLVQRTLAISRSTPILEHVSGSHVQRIPDNSATFLS